MFGKINIKIIFMKKNQQIIYYFKNLYLTFLTKRSKLK